ncbi:MAG: hypothetical protein P8099_03920 [Gemmatimonadota bacterium]|jgi:hypothetical protein
MQNPVTLLFRALLLFVRNRVHFRGADGVEIEDRGERFRGFRRVVVDAPERPPPRATFRVRFAFRNLSPAANRRLSLIPIPFIVAQPGFRSKTWLLGETTGDFMGWYEFDTVEAAQAYRASLPLRMMRRRAAPGSLTYAVTVTVSGRAEQPGSYGAGQPRSYGMGQPKPYGAGEPRPRGAEGKEP